MKILHYLIGLPPVRKGGMVSYAVDLMEKQSETEEVSLLIPGSITHNPEKRNRISVKNAGYLGKIDLYHVINPLPVPMANGIKDIEWFTLNVYEEAYRVFLERLRPDIIHIHSLMGLHLEFLNAAQELDIPCVYSSHDYFGICPKTDLIDGGNICTDPGEHCARCCRYAFSEKRMLLEQSGIYRFYRNRTWLTKTLQSELLKERLKSVRSYNPEQSSKQDTADAVREEEKSDVYVKLLEYYHKCFMMMNGFHFNSGLARDVFVRYLGPLQGKIIPPANSYVSDNRIVRHVDADCVRIGYLGGDSPYKGLHLLQESLDELWNEGIRNFRLIVYGDSERKHYEFCEYRDSYGHEKLEHVFSDMDVLAVPSTWQETFGMVVTEALSYGVPVIVTENVGARDLLLSSERRIGIVTKAAVQEMKNAVRGLCLDAHILDEMNENILQLEHDFDHAAHVNAMLRFYEEIIKK